MERRDWKSNKGCKLNNSLPPKTPSQNETVSKKNLLQDILFEYRIKRIIAYEFSNHPLVKNTSDTKKTEIWHKWVLT